MRNLQTVAKQKDILLVCKADEKLSVMADENMILSVLHNLVNNAIKYSHQGTNIHVETKKVAEFVQISVIDTGIGICLKTGKNYSGTISIYLIRELQVNREQALG